MRKKLKEKISEALSSVLPITVIVLLLSFTLAPMPIGTLLLFLLGAAMLIVGMGFFSLGADMAMMPIGEQMGRKLGGRWKLIAVAVICFLIGAMVTIAEPDLQVLARQVPAVPDAVIILAVAAGVGVFLVVSMLRTRFNIPLAPTLLAPYSLSVSAVAFLSNVMREIFSIIAIPFVAKYLGYVECAALPGAAAMDTVLPVVVGATHERIAIYSFTSGVVLSLAVPLLVPAIVALPF